MLARYFKKQLPSKKKKTFVMPYFYIFDAYQYGQEDSLTVNPTFKSWDSADVQTILIDEMFYILMFANSSYSIKHSPCSVRSSYGLNNSFFENKYFSTLRKNYTKIKSFTRN